MAIQVGAISRSSIFYAPAACFVLPGSENDDWARLLVDPKHDRMDAMLKTSRARRVNA